MPQDEFTSLRRNSSIRRSFRLSSTAAIDTDDRGWTLLHVGARKGDLKEVRLIYWHLGNHNPLGLHFS